jgi:ribosome-associated translation inhibitor RaiA
MEEAIDLVYPKLERQLVKLKEKKRSIAVRRQQRAA